MGEKMSLQQVREQIAAVATEDDYMLQGWIAAIDFHLTQPAQAVDALELLAAEYELTGNWAIANGLRANGVGKNAYDYEVAIRAVARALTAALPKDSNGAERVGS